MKVFVRGKVASIEPDSFAKKKEAGTWHKCAYKLLSINEGKLELVELQEMDDAGPIVPNPEMVESQKHQKEVEVLIDVFPRSTGTSAVLNIRIISVRLLGREKVGVAA
jgi:hypothetical protein